MVVAPSVIAPPVVVAPVAPVFGGWGYGWSPFAPTVSIGFGFGGFGSLLQRSLLRAICWAFRGGLGLELHQWAVQPQGLLAVLVHAMSLSVLYR